MLLDFDDVQDISDKEIKVNKKGKAKTGDEDLSKPFKEVLKCPFVRRIVEFSSPGHRMPVNAKIYDEMDDPKDHVGRFVGMGNQGEWTIPVWCRMFQQTLDGKARVWFNKLPSVDDMLKRVDDHLRLEEAFRNTELPKGEFQRKDTTVQWGQRNDRNQRFPYGSHRRRPEHKPAFRAQEQHPAPLVGLPSKENLNKYCDYHNEKGHSTNDCFYLKKQLEIALEFGKLNHLVKDIRQRGRVGQRNGAHRKAR
ncbi:hypothetical protein Tco_1558752 [Tanacetum coccineum]